LEFVLTYLTTLGLGGIAVAMIMEALGVPGFPGGILVILAGFLINQGTFTFYSALGASFIGYTIGSVAAYFIGRNMGGPVFNRLARYLNITPEKLLAAHAAPARAAGLFVLLGRFVPGLGNLTPYLAGLAQLELGWFLFYNSFFALTWGALYLSIGMFFGHNWPLILDFVRPRIVGLSVLGILLAVSIYFLRKERLKFRVLR